MLKKLILISAIMVTVSLRLSAQESRVVRDSNLMKLNNYISQVISMTPPVADSLTALSDLLIGAAKDTLMKTYIARVLFDNFFKSSIMGMETPAIYIAQNYFLNGKLKGFSDSDLEQVRFFTEFNKNSLIGMSAPPLKMESMERDSVSLYDIKSEYTLLYFYDEECSVCKEEAPKIKAVLRNFADIPITVFAVYVQSDRAKWIEDKEKNYPEDSLAGHSWKFVWDPELESGYQLKYGVTGTPKLFLLDSNKTIIGRGLRSSSLEDLLNSRVNTDLKTRQQLLVMFHKFFSEIDFSNEKETIEAFETIYGTIKEDTIMVRAIIPELYSFLKYSDNPLAQKASALLATKYIIEKPQMWDSTYVERMSRSVRLAQMNPVGEVATNLILKDLKGKKTELKRIKATNTLLFFFDSECPICKNELKWLSEMKPILQEKDIEVLAIYTGSNLSNLNETLKETGYDMRVVWDRNSNAGLFEKYDLSSVPAIYYLDKNKRVLAKDLTHDSLEKILK